MSTRPPTVLMIGAAPGLGGGIASVIEGYRRAGLFERWAIEYVDSYRGKSAGTQMRTMVKALMRSVGALASGRVGLVHLHSASRGSFWRKFLFGALAWSLSRPYLFHLHSGEFLTFYQQECRPWQQRCIRWLLRHAQCVLVLTPMWETALKTIEPRARCQTLLNPVALPATPQAVKSEVRTVLFLGRLRQAKGVYDLLAAAKQVLRYAPHTVFVLAGDGEIEQVRQRAIELGIDHAITLPGWIDGPTKAAALQSADLLVLPSYAEGLGICILEAMAHGIPVIASDVGGIPFALDDGRAGRLVPPGDVQMLSDALQQLMENTTLREQLARMGRIRAEALFSDRAVCERLEEIWGDAIK